MKAKIVELHLESGPPSKVTLLIPGEIDLLGLAKQAGIHAQAESPKADNFQIRIRNWEEAKKLIGFLLDFLKVGK